MSKKRITKIKEVRDQHEVELLGKKNVVGVMTGYKVKGGERTRRLSIICMVKNKEEVDKLDVNDVIPSKIDKIPTDVIKVGELSALQTTSGERTDRQRPCPMGTSGGHINVRQTPDIAGGD